MHELVLLVEFVTTNCQLWDGVHVVHVLTEERQVSQVEHEVRQWQFVVEKYDLRITHSHTIVDL